MSSSSSYCMQICIHTSVGIEVVCYSKNSLCLQMIISSVKLNVLDSMRGNMKLTNFTSQFSRVACAGNADYSHSCSDVASVWIISNMRYFNKNWAFSSREKSDLWHSCSMLTLLTSWWKRTVPDWHQRATSIYNFWNGQSAAQMLDNFGLCDDECWRWLWNFRGKAH